MHNRFFSNCYNLAGHFFLCVFCTFRVNFRAPNFYTRQLKAGPIKKNDRHEKKCPANRENAIARAWSGNFRKLQRRGRSFRSCSGSGAASLKAAAPGLRLLGELQRKRCGFASSCSARSAASRKAAAEAAQARCARTHASAHACARACLPACAHSRIPPWLHARMHVRLPDWPCMHASPPAWLHACMPALHAARARLPARHARSWPRQGGLRARARAASRAGLHARSQAGRHARMQLGGQARSCRAARLARARPGAQASCKHAATRVGVRALRGGQACRHAARRAGLRTCSNAGKHARAAMRAAMRACSHAGRLARMQPDGQADRHARPPAWRHARMPARLAARMPACAPCCMHACNLMLSEATQCNLM